MNRSSRFFYSCILSFLTLSAAHNIYGTSNESQVDLIVYSYDRPMQLYAFLESVQKYVSGLAHIDVIVRTSEPAFESAYEIVQKAFPSVQFIYQAPPYNDLKAITINCYTKTDDRYILFGVDDIIIKDHINLNQCIDALEQTGAHGFFLRMGLNLDYCYAMSIEQPHPSFQKISDTIYAWQFNQGLYDWNYPNNLDFTLYRKSDFIGLIKMCDYKTPYSLESQLMGHADMRLWGLCFTTSKILNFPLNVVQKDWPNASSNTYSTKNLLDLFNQGLKIDIQSLYQLENKSAHTQDNNTIQFIKRDDGEIKLPEKLIVIVTASYNNIKWWEWNLKSVLNQNYSNYYIMITDDCSNDGTGDALEKYIAENQLQNKVILHRNTERVGALHNLYTMIHSCPNDAIIATVDGDDALAGPEVLNTLNEVYSKKDVWLTYGQFVEHPSGCKGWCRQMPAYIIQNNAFREFPDLPSHLRTFYAWLFKCIKLEDMLYRGDFYSMTWDYAMMLPMIEMAGERQWCFENEILYIYNNANCISDHRISTQLQRHLAQIIRAKRRYGRLSIAQRDIALNLNNEKVDLIIFSDKNDSEALDQFLENIRQKITGIGEIFVLYVGTDSNQQKYYKILEKFSSVKFFEVDKNGANFQDLLRMIYIYLLQNNYVSFTYPDVLFTQSVNLIKCIEEMEKTQAYAFSLKLFKDREQSLKHKPPLIDLTPTICAWDYSLANGQWSCANTLAMNIYRRHQLEMIPRILEEFHLGSANDFQGCWAEEGKLDGKIGLCFKYSQVGSV